MAKISVSIPDELKEQLDTYAEQTGFKRSAAVAHILEAFFAGEVQDPEEISPERLQNMDHYLAEVMEYIEALHERKPKQFPRPEWMEEEDIEITRPQRSSFLAGSLLRQNMGY